ncbi:MAG: AAA family ATPase [Microcoleus sp.]
MDVTNVLGYQITEQLYTGTRTLVYRAIRTSDRHPVVIKILRNEYPNFNEILGFRNQYTIAKNLNLPSIIKPLSLEPYNNSYTLVMEDFGGVSLSTYLKAATDRNQPHKYLSLTEFLNLALQLADILHYLYQKRVIHKDIKPANILINPHTTKVKLIDFSIASLLPRETQEILNPNVLEGTLAYISPEQTGRMNRGIDYRSDFYSLGVTFYELLTGTLPFVSDDPMELVHCHLAKQSMAIHEVNPEIPLVLSEIVSKLMAKNAEDRYQSALGLKQDLENCQLQLQQTGTIEFFPIGKQDVTDRFIIPEKLYGRELEVQTILAAFERIASGTNPQLPLIRQSSQAQVINGGGESSHLSGSELILVAGCSGIGKTAVVNEVHKPIVRQRGYFIKGKYDQFQRNIPLSAFVQAFRDLMGQILSETDVQLQGWKHKILAALGDNAQLIIEVIPELEKIIGKQPPVVELIGTAAQNRFNLLFQKFIKLLSTKEHPLVIFLDDLQWTDSASMNLLKLLMTETDTRHLLLIGAYRDREIFPAHPLMLTLEEIRKAKATVNTITLAPLNHSDINHLIADTLHCSVAIAQPLTDLVYQKTLGNPFFTTQFVKVLHGDGLITFTPLTNTNGGQRGGWECKIAQIKELALTDDIVEFMAGQLQKLPPETQSILKLAAAIGNQFDLGTLAIVAEKSPTDAAADLWAALQEGLVIPNSEIYKFYQAKSAASENFNNSAELTITYKFLHDRVQQAAYSLIPDRQKQETHLKIGQLLFANTSAQQQEQRIFEIVNQLNMGAELITAEVERDRLAQLNLMAGRKAKVATAYAAAIAYLRAGLTLLAVDSWQTQNELTLVLHEESAEVEYLNTNFDEARNFAQIILQNTASLLEQLKSSELVVQIYIAEGKLLTAIENGVELLSKLGVILLSQTEAQSMNFQLPAVTELAQVPQMTDPYQLAAFRILIAITPPVHRTQPELFPGIVQAMMNLCERFGYSELAAYACELYGLYLWSVKQDVVAANAAGKLGLSILEQYNAREIVSKVNLVFGVFVAPCHEHIGVSLLALKAGILAGIEVGDIEHSSYCILAYLNYLFLSGEHLEVLVNHQNSYFNLALKLKQEHSIYDCKIWLQLSMNLQKSVENQLDSSADFFHEQQILSYLEANQSHQSLFSFHVAKLIWFYILEDYNCACESASKAVASQEAALGLPMLAAHNFYYSLSLLGQDFSTPMEPQSTMGNFGRSPNLTQVAENQQKMQAWAQYSPANFLHKFDLVAAEQHRILGNKAEAIELYDRAICLAKENQYLNEEALANELAAKFYLNWGKEKLAAGYMQEAYYCYARWGAQTKTDDLEKRYPQLLQPILHQRQLNFHPLETLATVSRTLISTTHSSSTISDALDFTSVLKAARAISSSIEIEELMGNLTRILLENSGAKKSALILPQDRTWQVRAITSITRQTNAPEQIETLLDSQPLDTCKNLPITIINYVKNTQKTVLMDRLQTEIPGLIGEYMLTHQPQSVLCTPILNQGHLAGILYLENQLTSGVFTSDRLQIINVLASQAAISIENARLYQQSQQALVDLQQAQLQIVQSEKMSALGNLVAGVAHEMNNPLGFISASLQQAKPTVAELIEHVRLYQETVPNPGASLLNHADEIDLEYSLEDLPKVINSMAMACDRLKNISTSLRTFSRADREYKVSFNIHQGIDSTILILKHRLKPNEKRPAIAVVTEYGKLPEVKCYPGQLNQVFMNILANAIDALDESNTGRAFAEIEAQPNQITIKTSVVERHVQVTIADNGRGMSEEVQQKIFDHLFTTKGVGKGTGLGLAIARQIIVEKHGGIIKTQSVLGKGTEFIIKIPIDCQ